MTGCPHGGGRQRAAEALGFWFHRPTVAWFLRTCIFAGGPRLLRAPGVVSMARFLADLALLDSELLVFPPALRAQVVALSGREGVRLRHSWVAHVMKSRHLLVCTLAQLQRHRFVGLLVFAEAFAGDMLVLLVCTRSIGMCGRALARWGCCGSVARLWLRTWRAAWRDCRWWRAVQQVADTEGVRCGRHHPRRGWHWGVELALEEGAGAGWTCA